jgi:hypothetical protein
VGKVGGDTGAKEAGAEFVGEDFMSVDSPHETALRKIIQTQTQIQIQEAPFFV